MVRRPARNVFFSGRTMEDSGRGTQISDKSEAALDVGDSEAGAETKAITVTVEENCDREKLRVCEQAAPGSSSSRSRTMSWRPRRSL